MDEGDLTSLKEYLAKETYDKRGNNSRETSYYGEFAYKYGSTYHPAREIPPVLQKIVDVIKQKFPETEVNSCLVTRYKDGSA